MTVVKRVSAQRKTKILSAIQAALILSDTDDRRSSLDALDKAMKLFNGRESGGLRYDELNDACEAFRKQAGFPSLSTCLVYIKNWQRQDYVKQAQDS